MIILKSVTLWLKNLTPVEPEHRLQFGSLLNALHSLGYKGLKEHMKTLYLHCPSIRRNRNEQKEVHRTRPGRTASGGHPLWSSDVTPSYSSITA